MGEFAPIGWGARMTKSQIKKYLKDMKRKKKKAQKKLQKMIDSPEAKLDELKLELLEQKLDNM